MDPNRFNAEVRPFLTEIPIGKQGIAFDRLDLDAWVDEYIACNGRPGRKGGKQPWRKEKHGGSSCGRGSGISTSSSEEDEFAKALEQASSRKRNNT